MELHQEKECIVKQGGNDGIDSEYEGKKAESLHKNMRVRKLSHYIRI